MQCFKFTQTGEKHLHRIGCQDAAEFKQPSKDIVIAAVSDGCSNAGLSDYGAGIVTKAFVDVFSDQRVLAQYVQNDSFKNMPLPRMIENLIRPEQEELLACTVISAIQTRIIRFLEMTDSDYSLLSATFVGIIIYAQKAVILHVGDGFVSRIHNNKIDIVSGPDNGLSRNITHFITSPHAGAHLKISRIHQFDRLMLSTDGLTKYFDINDPQHLRAIMQISKKPSLLQAFLKHRQQQFSDDCGIIVINRRCTILS